MRPLVALIAVGLASTSLAADPDEFPVIQAVPVEALGDPAAADPDTDESDVEEPSAEVPVVASQPLAIPNLAAPVAPAPATPTPGATPAAAAPLAIPNLAAPTTAPPLPIPNLATPAPTPTATPAPTPTTTSVTTPVAAPALQPVAPTSDEVPLAIPADAVRDEPAPATQASDEAPVATTLPTAAEAPVEETRRTRARPMTAAPWMPAVDRVRAWGRRAGKTVKDAITGERDDTSPTGDAADQATIDEPAGIDPGAKANPPPRAAEPELDAPPPAPPFHAGRADDAERPLAIRANAGPPPQRPAHARRPLADDPPDDRDADRDEREDDDDSDEDERTAGLFVGLSHDATRVHGGPASNTAIDLGIHLKRRLLLGVAGGELADTHGNAAIGWIGVRPGLVFAPDRRLHVRGDLLLGIGLSEATQLPVNIIEPRLAVELSLGDWARIDVHAAYRQVPPAQPLAKELSAPSVGVGVRLGWF